MSLSTTTGMSQGTDLAKSSESVAGLLRRKKSIKRQSTASASTPNKMGPTAALAMFGHKLTAFEHNEIKDYSAIYCLGLNAQKLNPGPNPSKDTDVYDDEDHFYKVVPRDHIAYRFEVVDKPILGKGTFGQVRCEC
uniref:Protein kinase domain-containing protein n=1 Tax=Biomphalaria glabrata TaxID=6526 RepID=A0A2C9JKR8_BIOGL